MDDTSVRSFSDADLAARLTDTEDHFTERKAKNDKGGWIRTTVAFANSAPIGYPAILFVGVLDDGTITDNGKIEDLVKSYSDTISNGCYPPIYTMPQVFTHSGKSCVVVTIPGSEQRPHFSGLSYIRDGTQTRPASEKQFGELIAQRLSKVRELMKWQGCIVTVEHVMPITNLGLTGRQRTPQTANLLGCNQFYVTVSAEEKTFSYTLADIELNFDHIANRLKLELRY